jgi:hypothetical protein
MLNGEMRSRIGGLGSRYWMGASPTHEWSSRRFEKSIVTNVSGVDEADSGIEWATGIFPLCPETLLTFTKHYEIA